MKNEIQDLKEIIEVATHILSGLDIGKMIQGVSWFIYSKYESERIMFILPSDIDDTTPDLTCYEGMQKKDKKINFESIDPLIDYFNTVECNQLTFSNFKETFTEKNITAEIESLSPEYLIPLKSDKGIIGLFIIGAKIDKSAYDTEELQNIYYIIKFTSIAIENSNLYRRAIIDRMTKLYTHHQFQKRLEEEILRCQRYRNGVFSIIMLDIDFFKKFNDTYGHLQGDIIIKEIADLINGSIRSNIDFPARYGGEEFAIILPEINGDGAFAVAERLRKIVGKHEFPGNDTPLHVTISLGVAEFDVKHVQHNSHIIDCADKALYTSKKTGKDKVTLGIYNS